MGVYASTPTVNMITMTTASSYFRFGVTFITYAVSVVLFIVGIIGIAILFPEYYLIHWFLLFTPFFSTVSLVASAITQFVSYLFKLTKYSVLAVVICTLAHFCLNRHRPWELCGVWHAQRHRFCHSCGSAWCDWFCQWADIGSCLAKKW